MFIELWAIIINIKRKHYCLHLMSLEYLTFSFLEMADGKFTLSCYSRTCMSQSVTELICYESLSGTLFILFMLDFWYLFEQWGGWTTGPRFITTRGQETRDLLLGASLSSACGSTSHCKPFQVPNNTLTIFLQTQPSQHMSFCQNITNQRMNNESVPQYHNPADDQP